MPAETIKTNAGEPVKITAEVGRRSLKQFYGYVYEEYDPDLRGIRGVRIYDEMRRADPTIAMGLRIIKWFLGRVAWTAEPAADTPQDNEAALFLDSCREDMAGTWSKFIRDVLTCLDFGWAYIEWTLKQRNGPDADVPSRFDDGRFGWRKLTLVGQETLLRWEIADDGGINGMWQLSIYTPPPSLVLVPMEKCVLFRTDDEKNNPEGICLLRPLYRSWYIKKQIEEIEAIGIERDLTGVLVISMPVSATDTDKTKAQDLIEQFKADDMAGFIAPQFGPGEHERWRFEIINSPGNKTIDTDKIVQRYQLEMARSFLAQFLMLGQTGMGSWALSSDQTEVFTVALHSIITNIEETINRYLVPPLFRFNDFGRLTALPKIKAGRLGKGDVAKLADALQKLGSGGFLTAGDDVEKYLRQELDLPELQQEPGQSPTEDTGQQAAKGDKQTPADEKPPKPPEPELEGEENKRQASEAKAKAESEVYEFHGGAHASHGGAHAGGKGGGKNTIKADGDASGLVAGLPPGARQAAHDSGLREVKVLNKRDYSKEVGTKGVRPGYESMAVMRDDGTMLLRKDNPNLTKTFHHEVAHALDPLGSDAKYKLSEDAEWLKASGWKASKTGKYSLRSTITNRPVSEYGKGAPWEDFAEAFATYTTGSKFDRRVMQGESEGRYNYMKKLTASMGFNVD